MGLFMEKNKGFTLVESLLALSVVGVVSAGVISTTAKKEQEKHLSTFLNEAASIVFAVDHRLSIDGYTSEDWNQLEWKNKDEVYNKLIKEELVSKYNKMCSGGKWNPVMNTERETNLLECGLWERTNSDFNISAEIELDDNDYVKSFDLFLGFNSKKSVEDNYAEIKRALHGLNISNNQEIAGRHSFGIASLTTGKDLVFKECLRDISDCGIKFSTNRSGGYEYIRLDGSNSMIESNLSFIESKGQAPLSCLRWVNTKKDGTGVWKRLEDAECGIGMYQNEGDPLDKDPVMVNVVADTGTFDNIMLDKKCTVYAWNGSNVVDTSKKSPCGYTVFTDESDPSNVQTLVYQVVEKNMANIYRVKELYADNAVIDEAEIDELDVVVAEVSNIVKAENTIVNDTLNISKEFNIKGESVFNGESTFNDEAIFEKNIFIKEDMNVNGDLISAGDLNVFQPVSLKDTIIKGTLTVKSNTEMKTDVEFKKELDVDKETISNSLIASNINSNTKINSDTQMTAPIGDFDNIKADFGDIWQDLSDIVTMDGTVVEYTSWKNAGSVYSCSVWSPDAATIESGKSFTQTRSCKQNQERLKKVYKIYSNGSKQLTSSSKETRITTISESRNQVGTKSKEECKAFKRGSRHLIDGIVMNASGSWLHWDYTQILYTGQAYYFSDGPKKIGEYTYRATSCSSGSGVSGQVSCGVCRSK